MRSARAIYLIESGHIMGYPWDLPPIPLLLARLALGEQEEPGREETAAVGLKIMLESLHCLQPLPIQHPVNSDPHLCIGYPQGFSNTTALEKFPMGVASHSHAITVAREAVRTVYIFPGICASHLLLTA